MNIFLQFPEIFDDDKVVLNSLKGLIKYLKLNPGFNIFYSSENLNRFKDSNQEAQVYLTDDIKVIRQLFYSARAQEIRPTFDEIVYCRWNLNSFTVSICEPIVRFIAEKLFNGENIDYIIFNVDDAIETCRNQILVFRDYKNSGYPDQFLKLDFVTNTVEFIEWVKTKTIQSFSLKNETRFEKKKAILVKGATVYFEKDEKRYWHLDTFHTYIEYEVYNQQGLHIGTANSLGELNVEGKVDGRTLKLKN